MIQQATTLILGAGASKDYGFPVGLELIEKIYNFYTSTSAGERFLQAVALILSVADHRQNNDLAMTLISDKMKLVKSFLMDLPRSGTVSIDDFIHRRKEYELVGKISILLTLSKSERDDIFDPQKKDDKLYPYPYRFVRGWYKYLWQALYENSNNLSTLETLKQNKLTIITFNYERSLEQFLFTTIKSMYGVSDSEAADAFNFIKIYHVYGSLGKLEWQKDNTHLADVINAFSPIMLEGGILGCSDMVKPGGYSHVDIQPCKNLCLNIIGIAESIKTYTEAQEAKEKDVFIEIIEKTNKLYFLGFGYHEQNLKALGLSENCTTAEIYGTTFGMGSAEVMNISNKTGSYNKSLGQYMVKQGSFSISLNNFNIRPETSTFTIEDYFRQVAPLAW